MSKPPTPDQARQRAEQAAGRVGQDHAAGPPDDMPPHPADDPGMNGRARRLFAVGPADDDDADVMLEAIPPYPAGQLVGPLRDLVEWGIRDGLPAAAIGAAGLAALATVTGYAELALSSTYTVRPALWITPVGNTGCGKSPALAQAFAGISALYDGERAAWAEQAKMAAEGAKVDVPPKPKALTLGDVTLPSAARWLEGNGGAGCLVYDELASMLGAMFAGDRAKLCEAWTARRALHIQRVGDGGASNAVDIYVSRPVLSIFGPLTPDNTKELGKEGDGFRARWLPHIIDGQAQMLDGGKQPETWTKAVSALYGHRDQLRRWHLTGSARTAYSLACERWKAELGQPYPQSVVEALRKAEVQCARIALVLAESCESEDIREYATDDRGSIPADAMTAAIALTDYVMDCWKALPGSSVLTLSMAEEKMSGAVDELFTWLENRPKGTEGLPEGNAPRQRATRREIQRARVGGASTAAMLSAMLDAYDRRWPGNVATIEQGGKGGRMRAFYYFPKRRSHGAETGSGSLSQ